MLPGNPTGFTKSNNPSSLLTQAAGPHHIQRRGARQHNTAARHVAQRLLACPSSCGLLGAVAAVCTGGCACGPTGTRKSWQVQGAAGGACGRKPARRRRQRPALPGLPLPRRNVLLRLGGDRCTRCAQRGRAADLTQCAVRTRRPTCGGGALWGWAGDCWPCEEAESAGTAGAGPHVVQGQPRHRSAPAPSAACPAVVRKPPAGSLCLHCLQNQCAGSSNNSINMAPLRLGAIQVSAGQRSRECCHMAPPRAASTPAAAPLLRWWRQRQGQRPPAQPGWVLAGRKALLGTSLGLLGRLDDVHKLGLEGGAAHLWVGEGWGGTEVGCICRLPCRLAVQGTGCSCASSSSGGGSRQRHQQQRRQRRRRDHRHPQVCASPLRRQAAKAISPKSMPTPGSPGSRQCRAGWPGRRSWRRSLQHKEKWSHGRVRHGRASGPAAASAPAANTKQTEQAGAASNAAGLVPRSKAAGAEMATSPCSAVTDQTTTQHASSPEPPPTMMRATAAASAASSPQPANCTRTATAQHCSPEPP